MDTKATDQAIAWTRQIVKKNNDKLPDWSAFKELVKNHLNDEFNMPFKMPQEYQYAYLRAKGLSQSDAFEQMGLTVSHEEEAVAAPKKSFWKFWE